VQIDMVHFGSEVPGMDDSCSWASILAVHLPVISGVMTWDMLCCVGTAVCRFSIPVMSPMGTKLEDVSS